MKKLQILIVYLVVAFGPAASFFFIGGPIWLGGCGDEGAVISHPEDATNCTPNTNPGCDCSPEPHFANESIAQRQAEHNCSPQAGTGTGVVGGGDPSGNQNQIDLKLCPYSPDPLGKLEITYQAAVSAPAQFACGCTFDGHLNENAQYERNVETFHVSAFKVSCDYTDGPNWGTFDFNSACGEENPNSLDGYIKDLVKKNHDYVWLQSSGCFEDPPRNCTFDPVELAEGEACTPIPQGYADGYVPSCNVSYTKEIEILIPANNSPFDPVEAVTEIAKCLQDNMTNINVFVDNPKQATPKANRVIPDGLNSFPAAEDCAHRYLGGLDSTGVEVAGGGVIGGHNLHLLTEYSKDENHNSVSDYCERNAPPQPEPPAEAEPTE